METWGYGRVAIADDKWLISSINCEICFDCLWKTIGCLSLVKFWCLIVAKKIPNNAVTPQSCIVLIMSEYCGICTTI